MAEIQQKSITQLKHWLEDASEKEVAPYLKSLQNDNRVGVQKLLRQWHNLQKKKKALLQRWQKMKAEEEKLRQQGYTYITGVDEVGRGCIAGPVVAASVILPADFYEPHVYDSKAIPVNKRNELAEIIKKRAIDYQVCFIDAVEIDRTNILKATKKAMVTALLSHHQQPDMALIDALELDIPFAQQSIIKGDTCSVSIAAASIIAKVTRDEYMDEMDIKYPEYGFQNHKGYGTAQHYESIRKNGLCSLHRKSFIHD